MNEPNREDSVTLEILQAIDERENVTQRHLSERLGVALGLTNSYLKRCARKGYIKIQQAPANRYLYYLTPKGFAEKSRLTAQYLTASFGFYRKASNSINSIFIECREKKYNRVMLCGISELAEIARLKAIETKIEVTGFFDPNATTKSFIELQVWRSLEQADEFDACILTALNDVEAIYQLLHEEVTDDRLFIPNILDMSLTGS